MCTIGGKITKQYTQMGGTGTKWCTQVGVQEPGIIHVGMKPIILPSRIEGTRIKYMNLWEKKENRDRLMVMSLSIFVKYLDVFKSWRYENHVRMWQ